MEQDRSGRAPERAEVGVEAAGEWVAAVAGADSAREQAPEGVVCAPIAGKEHPIRREFHVPR